MCVLLEIMSVFLLSVRKLKKIFSLEGKSTHRWKIRELKYYIDKPLDQNAGVIVLLTLTWSCLVPSLRVRAKINKIQLVMFIDPNALTDS